MTFRVISQIRDAEACERPKGLPKSRARGVKARGIKYERDLAAAIPSARHGQWFRFEDGNGPGCCQTDLLLETQWGLAILEAKLTWTWEGHRQLDQLYIPVLRQAYSSAWAGKPPHIFGLVVCKVLTPDLNLHRDWICRDLYGALSRAAEGKRTVLHWMGQILLPDRPALVPPGQSRPAIPLASIRAVT